MSGEISVVHSIENHLSNGKGMSEVSKLPSLHRIARLDEFKEHDWVVNILEPSENNQYPIFLHPDIIYIDKLVERITFQGKQCDLAEVRDLGYRFAPSVKAYGREEVTQDSLNTKIWYRIMTNG